MRKRTIDNYIKKIHRDNSGFTLIELIVVLILMGILLGTTLYAGLGWQDWAQFKHEEACAEEIFYAAQNQLTELDSSNALYRKVARPMMNSDTEGDYIAGYVVNNIDQIVYDRDANGDVKYNSKTIWINSNKDKDPGKLVRLRANANEYDTYVNNPSACGEEAKLLFDIISPYISDKSVLNGAIILEFSPDAGQVFSVCYSDKASSLTYGTEGSGAISVMNRILQIREDKMLGYFSVDTLSKKIRGRGTIDTNLRLKIDNGEVYSLVVEDDDAELEANDLLEFTLYDGENSGKVDLMKFSVSNKDITTYTSFKEGLKEAQSNPVDVQVVYNENYKGNYDKIESFSVPIFRVGTLGTKNQVYVILDAADVQAQSLAFSQSVYFKDKDPYYNEETEEAFKNTYSFYRFGLSKDINYIYADVTVLKNGGNATSNVVNSYSDDPTAYHIQQSTPRGECVAFASHELTDGNNVYEIENMRHFYNIRYESDYKIDESKKDTFKLIADISWTDFIGGNKDGINYFLNSYVDDNTIKNGINYNGNIDCVSGTTTADYPFPGFRKLDKNDKFTQDVANGGQGESFAISDLNITIAGNIVYGVYGQDIKSSCKLGDFSKTQGYEDNYSDQDSKGMKAARAGKMPLGLFAENQGVIENITLNRHKVIGVMNATQGSTSRLLYTCMVGGFAGNNLGHVSNLTLLDHTTNVATSDKKAGVTKVNGRTDVGGIIGRQSYIVKGVFDSTDVTISGLKNYGTVSGLEHVGGIVGRAYTRFVTDKTEGEERFANIYENAKYNGGAISSYDQILSRYYAYHDGYNITDSYKSMTDTDVSRNGVITISDCHNRGKVSGDSLFYSYIDSATMTRIKNMESDSESSFENATIKSCACIGGIAGTTMDGIINDCDKLTVNGKTVYESICEPFANGGKAYVIIKNCDSYVEYDINPSDILDASKYPSIKYDNYVGGLVGYSKMTAIENCNTKQDAYIKQTNNVYQSYVLGNRFVGGLVGCSDLTRFDTGSATANPDGYNNRIYAATNYNNVIGRVFVGGIAGGMGIGSYNINELPNELVYRSPSVNYARYASVVDGEVLDGTSDTVSADSRSKSAISRNILNTGAVLCLKTEDDNNRFKEYGDGTLGVGIQSQNHAGYCGGITGLACTRFNDADNIQSEATKAYIFKILNNDDNTQLNINTIAEQEVADTVISKLDGSNFGGAHVGGIAGYINGSNKVNYSNNTASYVDAVVCGQHFVGGIFGNLDEASWPKAFSCYPTKKSSSSSGMTVIGDDCVGGLFGRLPQNMLLSDETNITSPYTVIGRYAVGGLVGLHASENKAVYAQGRIDANLVPSSTVKVYGKCFVGGMLGYSSSDQIGIPPATKNIDFNNVSVIGDYFVGGLAGGLADNSDKYNILDFVPSVNVGDNVSVQANAFGGGVAGLYYVIPRVNNTSYSEFINNGSTIYRIANEKCVYSGDDKNIQTFDNIVNADNRGDAIFNKDDSRVVSTDFGGYTNKVDVTSRIFAGGLFGYVPNCIGDQKINIKGFVNGDKIKASSYLQGSVAEASDTTAKYSYLGGVIGRVPRGMMLINCTNTKNGEEYTSQGTYIGGLTEVNAGVISGDISKDNSGVITVNSYLINNTSYTYDKNVGAIAGVNGTLATGCDGVIQFCQNRGDIISTAGEASGIVASQARASVVTNSINLGAITGTSKAAGIVASPSGTDIVELCRNYGPLEGATKNGIAGGTVGTLNKNLEASGLSEADGGNPVANMEKSSQTRNFYISGDDSYTPSQDESYKFYNIDFIGMGYNNTVGVNYNTYYDMYDWYIKQTVESACTEGHSNNPNYTNYSFVRLKVYYPLFSGNINTALNKTNDLSRYVYIAYRVIKGNASQTSLEDFMSFYETVITTGKLPGVDDSNMKYTNTPFISLDPPEEYTPKPNPGGKWYTIDFSYFMDKPDNVGNDNKYYKEYEGGTGPGNAVNSILGDKYWYGGDTYVEQYAAFYTIYEHFAEVNNSTVYNTNYKDTQDYLSKVYAVYRFLYGDYNHSEDFDDFYNFVVQVLEQNNLPDTQAGGDSSGDYSGSGGGSYSLENSWPKQLRVSTTGQTFKIVYYNGGFHDTNIVGLTKNPNEENEKNSPVKRITTFLGGSDKPATNSLDSLFVDMVNNEQEYPNSAFVPN